MFQITASVALLLCKCVIISNNYYNIPACWLDVEPPNIPDSGSDEAPTPDDLVGPDDSSAECRVILFY